MRKLLILFAILTILSCSRDKNKPYDNVNIIREETKRQPQLPSEIRFPRQFSSAEMLLMEIDFGDIFIESWDESTISVDLQSEEKQNYRIEAYESNSQVVVRESAKGTDLKVKTVWNCKVPKNISLIVRSQNGDVHISNVNGTFEIQSPVGDVFISNSKNAAKVVSQSGNITVKNWEQMGRSKFTSGSGFVKAFSSGDLYYDMELHSGSDSLILDLGGHDLKTNLEVLTFKGEGVVISDFQLSSKEDFYSDALDKDYDLRKFYQDDKYPMISLSTGNGKIILKK